VTNQINLTLRQFPVVAHDHRTGKEEAITVTVTRDQLRAAGVVGQSSKELIERLCERHGYTVIEIGQPDKVTVTVDLDKLVEQHEERQKAEWLFQHGHERRGVGN
jgi:hypothetical protein